MSPASRPTRRRPDRADIEALVARACHAAAARLAARHTQDPEDSTAPTPNTHPPDKLDLDIVKALLPYITKPIDDSRTGQGNNTEHSNPRRPPTDREVNTVRAALERLGTPPSRGPDRKPTAHDR